MLASCGSLAVAETLEQHRLPVQYLLILASIGLLGLMLPSGKQSVKVLYTAIEVGQDLRKGHVNRGMLELLNQVVREHSMLDLINCSTALVGN